MRTLLVLLGLAAVSSAQAAVQVKDISLARAGDGYRIHAKATETTPYTIRRYTEPDRLLIDIPNARLVGNPQVKPVTPGSAPALRYSQFSKDPDVVRIVVHLPEGSDRWREESAAPAMNITLFLPGNAPVVAKTPAAGVKPVPQKATPEKKPDAVAKKPAAKPMAKKPENPPAKVLSAREVEKEMRAKGAKILPASAKTEAAAKLKPSAARVRTPARKVSRTSVASRGSFVKEDPLPGVLGPLPPVPPPPDALVEPDWTADEAMTLIQKGDAPDIVRQRLQEVVSDPLIRTSRYVWSGESPGAFDCSGLALYIYDGIGVKLPRVSLKQSEFGQAVDRENLRAGDLVFFITRGDKVSHVGIYLGDGRFLHAANPREHLKITSLDAPYYAARYAGARRVYQSAVASGDSSLRVGG